MKFEDLKRAMLAGAYDLIEREEELSRLDSFVGDGDHGVTIKKGFKKIIEKIDSENPKNMFDLLFTSAMALADTMGGAIGPILASFFLGMGTTLKGKEKLEVEDLNKMFSEGLKSVQELGEAKPGDCTMVDALYPAVISLQKTKKNNVKEAMQDAVDKAYEGALKTIDMSAKLGRAKNLGDKSKGYVDAGAMSIYYFLKAFSNSM